MRLSGMKFVRVECIYVSHDLNDWLVGNAGMSEWIM